MINMRRREFITLFGGLAAAWPLVARAQQVERVRRVGVLMVGTDDADSQGRVAAFRQGLQEVGWSEGRDLLITSRWSAGNNDSIRAAASNLVRLKPDVLLVNGRRGLVALQQETPIIPIVFADPVEPATVASLAPPGGNITGFAYLEHPSIDDYVGLLKELAPSLARVAIVMSSDAPNDADRFRIPESTASRFGIKPVVMPVIDAAEIEGAIAAFARESCRLRRCDITADILRVERTCHGRGGTAESGTVRTSAAKGVSRAGTPHLGDRTWWQ